MPATRVRFQPTAASQRGAGSRSGFDARSVAYPSLVAILGSLVTSAFTGGFSVPALLAATILPFIVAFLMHPGPHRVRRVVAVLVFTLIVTACRNALAAVRTTVRGRRRQPRDRRRDADGKQAEAPVAPGRARRVSATEARLARAWLRQVVRIAAIAVAITIVVVMPAEALRGQLSAPSPSGPTLHVPEGGINARAGDHTATRVTYAATATDAHGHRLVPVCRPPSGALFGLGETRVECSATDANGDRAEGRFVVTVSAGGDPPPRDHVRPALTVPDDLTHHASTADGYAFTG